MCDLHHRRLSGRHVRLEVRALLASAWGLLDGGTTVWVAKGVFFCCRNVLSSQDSLVRLAREINRRTVSCGVLKLLSCEGLRELASLPATLVIHFPSLPWARPGLGYLGVCRAMQKNHPAVDARASVAARSSVCGSREHLLH